MPFREPGRVLAPLLSWAVIAAVAYVWIAPRSPLPGWQLALIILAGIPVAGLVGFGIVAALGFLASVAFASVERLRGRRFRRFLELLDTMDGSASADEARRLSLKILEEGEGQLRSELENARPLLEAASAPGPLQSQCVSILLRHGRGGGGQARALYSGRSAVERESLEEWVRWFSLWGEPGEETEDVRPLAYAYAFELADGEARRRVLNRLLTEARPNESWWSVARSLEETLQALDPEELAPMERDGLAILLRGS